MSDILKLAARLREHAEGPPICPKCGNERNKEWKYECISEGMCDWNMDFGTHTNGGIDIYQAKLDMLEAALILEKY